MAIDFISPIFGKVIDWIVGLFRLGKPREPGGIQIKADRGSQGVVNTGALTATNSPGAIVVGTLALHGRHSAQVGVVPMSVDEIVSAVDAAPDLQQADVAKNYVGLRVEWPLYYAYASGRSDIVVVRLVPKRGSLRPRVEVSASLTVHPWLKVTVEGRRIRVRGRILNVQFGQIILDDVDLELLGEITG
jgi:hypothetical protein